MSTISRILPPLEKLSTRKEDDLYVCALGFEDRCAIATRRLSEDSYKAKFATYIKYDTNQEDNAKNELALNSYLQTISNNFLPSEYIIANPSESIRNFHKVLNEFGTQNIKTVSVDISSFSSGAILQILNHLIDIADNIRILYTEAEDYSPSKTDAVANRDHLSFGIKDVVSLPEFGGLHSAGYPHLLVIFLGFSAIRAKGVYNWFQPYRKLGIVGEPPKQERKWRADLVQEIHAKYYQQSEDMIRMTTFDYRNVLEELESMYVKFSSQYNIGIASLGSKMQTLGLLLFLRKHKDVQAIISAPERFDGSKYSTSYLDTWEINFNMKNLRWNIK